jgi:hypothetical protein
MKTDTKPNNKTCSKCGKIKEDGLFKPQSCICKDCRNKESRDKYNNLQILDETHKCSNCNTIKNMNLFVKNRNICKTCNNENRRNKYLDNEEHRQKLIEIATIFKKRKSAERAKQREEERIKLEEKIGQENTICKSFFNHYFGFLFTNKRGGKIIHPLNDGHTKYNCPRNN